MVAQVGGSIMGNHLPEEGFDTGLQSENWGLTIACDGPTPTALITNIEDSLDRRL